MIREIKFEYGFESVNGIIKKVYTLSEIPNIKEKCDVWNVLPIVYVREFSNKTDKNGMELFEGDIVRILYTDWSSKSENDPRTLEQYLIDIASIGEVVFNDNSWEIKTYSKKYDDYNFSSIQPDKYGYIEKIGTKHENPELLLTI